MCIDMHQEDDELITSTQNSYSNERIIIVTNVKDQDNLHKIITIVNDKFELQHVEIIYNENRQGLQKAEVYSRRGKHLPKWWCEHRSQKILSVLNKFLRLIKLIIDTLLCVSSLLILILIKSQLKGNF